MDATAEIQVVPIGTGVSVRKEIQRVVDILRGFGLTLETHASGTNLEGDLSTILQATETLHETLHREGVVRLVTYLKLETRTDKTPTLAGKRL